MGARAAGAMPRLIEAPEGSPDTSACEHGEEREAAYVNVYTEGTVHTK